MSQRIALLSLLLLIVVGCDEPQPMTRMSLPQSPHFLLLDYPDFGPQDVAQELLGRYWYQWDQRVYEIGSYPYDIKVVVYKDVPGHDARLWYPVLAGDQLDFRLVEYRKAVAFLEAKHKQHQADPIAKRTICLTMEATLDRIHEKWPIAEGR